MFWNYQPAPSNELTRCHISPDCFSVQWNWSESTSTDAEEPALEEADCMEPQSSKADGEVHTVMSRCSWEPQFSGGHWSPEACHQKQNPI